MWIVTALANACEPITVPELDQLSAGITSAFAAQDLAAMRSSVSTVERSIPCLTDRVTAADVARWLRRLGLAAYVEKDRDRALAAFETARFLVPAGRFEDTLLAPTHPIRTFHDGVPADPPIVVQELAPPDEGWITIDGQRTLTAPQRRAWFFQRFDATGTVRQTALVWSEALPVYDVGTQGVEVPDPPDVPKGSPPDRGMALHLGAGVMIIPTERSPVLGTVAAGLTVPLAGPVDLDLQLAFAGGVTTFNAVRTLQGLPLARVGARAWLAEGVIHPYLGAGGLLAVNNGGNTVNPGAAGWFGLDVGTSARWTLEVEGGVLSPVQKGQSSSGTLRVWTGVALPL